MLRDNAEEDELMLIELQLPSASSPETLYLSVETEILQQENSPERRHHLVPFRSRTYLPLHRMHMLR